MSGPEVSPAVTLPFRVRAQAGTHPSAARSSDTWMPASAGMTSSLFVAALPYERGELADAVVVGVADIDCPVRAYRRAVRPVEAGFRRGAAVAVAALAAAGDRRDDAAAPVDQTDRVVLGIDNEDVAVAVERHLFRRVEYRGNGRTAVAGIAACAGAGNGGDGSAGRIDRAQPAPLPFENVDGAVGRDLDGARAEDAGRRGRAAVAAVLADAGPREGLDRAGHQIDDANAVVGDIGDEQPPVCSIERQPVRLGQPGARGGTAVAAEPGLAGAGQGRDHPGHIDPADDRVEAVGDIEIAGPADRDAVGFVEARLGRRTAVAGISLGAVAGDRRDRAGGGIDAADAVVEGVGEIEVAGGVERHVERAVQHRRLGRAAIAGKPFLPGPDRRRYQPVPPFRHRRPPAPPSMSALILHRPGAARLRFKPRQPSSASALSGRATLSRGWRSARTPIAISTMAAATISPA